MHNQSADNNFRDQPRVQLATFAVIPDVWVPYASACLYASCISDPEIISRYTFKPILYKYMDRSQLQEELADVDILALTCYVWNTSYNQAVTQLYKLLKPNGVVIWGGPQIPNHFDPIFYGSYPQVDYFVSGQGELVFKDLLLFLENKRDFPTSQVIKNEAGAWVRPAVIAENQHVEVMAEFSSPYLTDAFDHIFAREVNVFAVIETNRGCPFKCAFCDWGGQSNSRVAYGDSSHTREALDKIFSNPKIGRLVITDANFGLRKADLETVEYLIELKKKHGRCPKIIYGGLVKNGSPYLADILKKIHLELEVEDKNLKLSFQTHTPKVLENVERKNIRNSILYETLLPLRGLGMNLTSEMIIALPGETATTWLDTLATDFTLNITYMRAYNLIIVPNTKMNESDYRKQFEIKTKRIRFPHYFRGKTIACLLKNASNNLPSNEADPRDYDLYEEYEAIYECISYNLNELKKMHSFHWVYHTFINTNLLRPLFHSLLADGHSFHDIMKGLLEHILTETQLLKSIWERNQKMVDMLFKPEPITLVDDIEAYFYFTRDMRGRDVYKIVRDSLTAEHELNEYVTKHWPDYDFTNLLTGIFENIRQSDRKMAFGQKVRHFFGVDARLCLPDGTIPSL